MHEIDHVGTKTARGNHGGRRQLQPKQVIDPLNIPASGGEVVNRPQKDNSMLIPAILNINPTDETRALYGFKDSESGTVTIAAKYLEDRKIIINASSDYFNITGEIYKIRLLQDVTTLLDSNHTYTYTIKKDL
jgi:hypothetical protein